MNRETLKQTLIGCAELLVFMPTAIRRFSADREDALRSFIFPLLLYPLILSAFSYNNHIEDQRLFVVHMVVSWAGLFGFFWFVHWIAGEIGRRQYFWQFVNVMNSQNIITAFLVLPMFLRPNGPIVHGGFFETYSVFSIMVELLFTGFILMHTMRLPWMLGGFFASIYLFFSDVGYKIIAAAGTYILS